MLGLPTMFACTNNVVEKEKNDCFAISFLQTETLFIA